MSREIDLDESGDSADDLENFENFEDIVDEADVSPRSLPRARATVEGVMGLLAAFFIGFPAPLLAAMAAAHLPLPVPALFSGLVAFIASGSLSVLVVRLAARALEGDERRSVSFNLSNVLPGATDSSADEITYIPLALAMAIRLPKWPTLVRAFVAVWWLCHFVAAAMIGHAAAAHWLNNVNNRALFVAVPVTLLFTFAFLFAANLYLMLAVAVCVRHPGLWLIAWRHRFVVDLIIAAILLATGG